MRRMLKIGHNYLAQCQHPIAKCGKGKIHEGRDSAGTEDNSVFMGEERMIKKENSTG